MLPGTMKKKGKMLGLASMVLASSTVFGSCGLTDIRDNLIGGSLDAVRGAAGDLIGAFLPDFNELLPAIPPT